MAVSVSLTDIIETLEVQLDETSSFVDPGTGEVHTLSHEIMRYEEEGRTPEGLLDWQKDEFHVVQRMTSAGGFLKLPSKWDVYEWEIMQEFALQVESDSAREELLNAIRGKGAFRYFKDTLRRRRMEPQWDEFRDQALRRIAIDWCEEHGLAWHEE